MKRAKPFGSQPYVYYKDLIAERNGIADELQRVRENYWEARGCGLGVLCDCGVCENARSLCYELERLEKEMRE